MEIGILKLENIYEWMMFIYGMMRIIANISVTTYMVHLFIKNLKEPYVDIIKLLQTSLVFLWFFSDIITILIPIFDNSILDNPIVTIFVLITDPYMFCYGLNQFAWLILIQHLITYRMMAEGKSYSECRKIIRNKEIKLFILVTAILSTLMIIQIVLYTLKTTKTIDEDLAKKLINIEGLFVSISFAVSEYILYLKVNKTLERCLHSYYMEHKKSIKYRMLINMWYFSLFSLLFIANIFAQNKVSLMVTLSMIPPYEGYLNIVYIFGILLTDIPMIIYAFINAKNIKFRDWMIVVMEGHRILKHFKGFSIFIKKFKTIKINLSTSNNQDDEEHSHSGSYISEFKRDYEETSEYQDNYKQQFIMNRNSSV